ncbi:unnamed protein product [Prorocentrum cordatum]|uniref:Glucosylceramidase n=1 Tax=Prorocentrum cordatum TaxID=2364126 RepID=A0ABN9S6N5_9DINO|nr:unnamed protein product [Polarella glacialis]
MELVWAAFGLLAGCAALGGAIAGLLAARCTVGPGAPWPRRRGRGGAGASPELRRGAAPAEPQERWAARQESGLQGLFSEPRGGDVLVTETARGSGAFLRELPGLSWEPDGGTWTAAIVDVDVDSPDQELLGFGGAFTEAASTVFSQMGGAAQDEFLDRYFGPEGLGYTLGRVHINSCDFSLEGYSFAERRDDWDLAGFDDSVGHDVDNNLIPLIARAQTVVQGNGQQLKLIASPWSPPGWMKTSGQMDGSDDPGLRAECRGVWAKYISRWISAYGAHGVPIWGVTVQNEPGHNSAFESCRFSAEQEAGFLADHLGPQLRADHPGVKVFVFDDNKDSILEFAEVVLKHPSASTFADGVAFHWYSGDYFDRVADTHEKFPDVLLLASEATYDEFGGKNERDPWEFGEGYAHDIIGDLNAGAVGWIDWNLLLDEAGGPNHVGNTCQSAMTAGPGAEALQLHPQYYFIAHFSKFIPPGSRRLRTRVGNRAAGGAAGGRYYGSCSGADGLEATSFLRPDGFVVVVVLNCGAEAIDFALRLGAALVRTTVPPRAIQTYELPRREGPPPCDPVCEPGLRPDGCRCMPVDCPEHSEGDNVSSGCACSPGFSGAIEGSGAPPFFVGACWPEPCPLNSEGASVASGCECAAGCRGTLEAARHPPFYRGGCEPEPCPEGSEGLSIPDGCRCRAGFQGDVSATSSEPFYSGGCVPVPCPANSESASGFVGDGGCDCMPGYSGTVGATAQEPYYDGACEPIAAEGSSALA